MDEIPAKKKLSVPLIILIAVIILAILGAIAWLALRNTSSNKPLSTSTTKSKQQPTSTKNKLAPATASSASSCPGVVNGNTLAILYRSSGPVPACEQVRPTQSLVIINSTSQPVSVGFGGMTFTVDANKSYRLNKQFGSYLSPGVHNMTFSSGGTAQIWEK